MSNFGFNTTIRQNTTNLQREIQSMQRAVNKAAPTNNMYYKPTGTTRQQEKGQQGRSNNARAPRITTSQPLQPKQMAQKRQNPTAKPNARLGQKQAIPSSQKAVQSQQYNNNPAPIQNDNHTPVKMGMGQRDPTVVEMEQLCREVCQKTLTTQEKAMQDLTLLAQKLKEDVVQFKHFINDSTARHVLLKEELKKYVDTLLRDKIDKKMAEQIIKQEASSGVKDLQKVIMNEVQELENKRQEMMNSLQKNYDAIQAQVLVDGTSSFQEANRESKKAKDYNTGTWVLLRGVPKDVAGEKWQEVQDIDSTTGQISRAWIPLKHTGNYRLMN